MIERYAANGRALGADQAAALRGVLTSGARLEVLSAAAGTGKSFTVGALADAWTEAGHQVVGLAPSQVAAEVLAEEGLSVGERRRLARRATPARRGDARPAGCRHRRAVAAARRRPRRGRRSRA